MKAVNKEYYDSFDRRKKTSPIKTVARKILNEFIPSDMEIVELDSEDFEGLFDLKDDEGAIKAATALRNLLNTSEYARADAYVSCRKGHVFLMRRTR